LEMKFVEVKARWAERWWK